MASVHVRAGLMMVRKELTVADEVLEANESTVLDLVDELLNNGVMATGDVTLGVAGVDLVYLHLSALLCAADRLLPARRGRRIRRRKSRSPRRRVRG